MKIYKNILVKIFYQYKPTQKMWMDTGKCNLICGWTLEKTQYAWSKHMHKKFIKPEKIDKPQFLLKERSTERNIKDGL